MERSFALTEKTLPNEIIWTHPRASPATDEPIKPGPYQANGLIDALRGLELRHREHTGLLAVGLPACSRRGASIFRDRSGLPRPFRLGSRTPLDHSRIPLAIHGPIRFLISALRYCLVRILVRTWRPIPCRPIRVCRRPSPYGVDLPQGFWSQRGPHRLVLHIVRVPYARILCRRNLLCRSRPKSWPTAMGRLPWLWLRSRPWCLASYLPIAIVG